MCVLHMILGTEKPFFLSANVLRIRLIGLFYDKQDTVGYATEKPVRKQHLFGNCNMSLQSK